MSRYELKDLTESGTFGSDDKNKKNGIRISVGTGFVIVLLAIVAAIGVGLIVHFAENRKLEYTGPEVNVNGGAQAGQQHGSGSEATSTVKPRLSTEHITNAPPLTTTAKPEARSMKLPGSFSPSHYDLTLEPNIYTGDPSTFTFSGSVSIQMKSTTPSTNVTLNMRDLNITEDTLNFISASAPSASPSVSSYSVDKDLEFLIVHLNAETIKGHDYTLSMAFKGKLLDDLQGLYYGSYTHGNQTVYLAATQFESLKARKAFPCFDEPAMKATFKVTLVRKSHLTSLSNMPIANRIPRGDFMKDVYQTTKKMSTYLLAFIVGDIRNITQKVPNSDVTFGVWFRPELVGQTEYALSVGSNTTANYNSFFNISFPLPKQDMIALPDFRPGAMENWGLVTYRETRMLYEEGVTSEAQKQETVTVITHELGHQWFGNLVTMEWWNDIWLNEGFATFMEHIGADMLYPHWRMFDQFVVHSMHRVFDLDSLSTSHPLSSDVITVDDLSNVFDNVAYFKGATLIRMVRFILGEDTFQKGLHRYLSAHAYANANHDDLWRALTQQSIADKKNTNVSEVMSGWTLQSNYPVVTVIKNNGKLVVSQQRFRRNTGAEGASKRSINDATGYLWKIPFTYTTSAKPDFNITGKDIKWVTSNEQEIEVSALKTTDWVIANLHQYGYYRVNYEDSNWHALINQLKTKHEVIPAINRAQIIDDAWGLARAGLLSTRIALQTLDYLDKETDLVPWTAAKKQIDYMESMIRRSEHYGRFKMLMVSKLKDLFNAIKKKDVGATHVESLTRSLISELACKFGLAECLQESKKLFDQWMTNPDSNPINPNIRQAVYCTAIAEGGSEQWEFALEQLRRTTKATERSLLMTSLSCTRSTWLLSRLLKLCITPAVIRKQDASNVMGDIAQSSVGQMLAFDFVRENWDYLYNDYGKGAFSFSNLIDGITNTFNTDFQLTQLKSFHDSHEDLGIPAPIFNRMVEEIASNSKWVKDNQAVISDWLKSRSGGQSARLTDVRLPTHLHPILYDVTLKPNMYSDTPENFTFEGHVKIYMHALKHGSNVTLHANNLDIQDDTVVFKAEESGGSTGPSYIANSMEKDLARQFRIFYLDGPVTPGTNYSIEMNFTAKLTNDLVGLYYSRYKRNNKTVYITTSDFEPTDARRAFPMFDEPQIKAAYNVRLVRKSHMKSLSNMPIKRKISIEDDFIIDEYETTRKMSSYLLAFIICDFEYTENTTSHGIKYRAWSRPESINQTLLALKTGVRVLSHYEDYFNITFPLPKQEMIAIPDFSSGAMENWGLITYRETSMLYEPGVSSLSNRQRVEVVVAHELAHQWFGDLVTMKWWDDLWLNEGFASFVEYMGVDFVSPELKMFEQFVFDLHAVFGIDSLVTSHPIYIPVQNPDEITEIFDTISYNKGASVLRMMRFFLGEETFRKGINIYLTNRMYSNADHDDLWQGLQTQADREGKRINVRAVMDTWIKQMNYPLVTVSKSDSGKIQIRQERFLSNKDAVDPRKFVSPFGYKWKIPFTFTTSQNANFRQTDKDVVWLEDDTKELDDNYPGQGWLLGNVQQFGVYRVHYSEDNWNALVDQLSRNHTVIHTLNRAQIINDAFGLAKAKRLNMLIALGTMEYLDKETEYVPWSVAGSELDYLENMLAETEAYGDFQEFVKRKVQTQYSRLGLEEKNDNDPMESYLRSTIASFACGFDDENCVNTSKNLFNGYMADPSNNPISPNLKSMVYCTAVRTGGTREWQFVHEQYVRATVQAEKARLLYALTCTRQIWIINKLLHMALDGVEIRTQDAYSVFVDLAYHPVGSSVAWDFFRANFDTLFEIYGNKAFSMANIVKGVTAPFNTEFRLQQMKDFQELHPDMGTGTRAFAQAIEKVSANVRWMSDYYNIVSQWLAARQSSG